MPARQQARTAHRRHRDRQQLVDAESRVVAGAEAHHDIGIFHRRTGQRVPWRDLAAIRIDQPCARIDAHVQMRLRPDEAYDGLIHGHDERISIEALGFGVRVLFETVSDFCTSR